jgi:hypothetical protein
MESISAVLQITNATMTLAILLGVRHCLHPHCLPQQHLGTLPSPPPPQFLLLHQLCQLLRQNLLQ